jgi:hypothetical protein
MNTPRHRGGQLGNANALKHGFYTRRFKEKDISGVEQINVKDLAEEVALIRILARRLVEASSPSADLYELAGVLRAVCLASTTITRVIKTHALLSSASPNYQEEIEFAIQQVNRELRGDHSSPSPVSD